MIESIENIAISFVRLPATICTVLGLILLQIRSVVGRFIAHFGTGLFLHSMAQILQLGIMTKETEASYGCDCVASVVISVDDLYKSTMAEFTNDRQEE